VNDAEMRPFLARVVAVAFATFWGYLFFCLIDLMVVFDRTAGFYESYLLETEWGLLYTVMAAAPLVALAFRPGWLSLVAQVAGVGICVAISAVAAFAWRQLLAAAGLVLTAAILYALSGTPRRTSCGDESAHPKSALHWPLLIVCVCRDSAIHPGCPRPGRWLLATPPTDWRRHLVDRSLADAGSPGAFPTCRRGPGFVQSIGVEDIAVECGDQRGLVGRGVTVIPTARRQSRRPRWVVGNRLVDSTPARRCRPRGGETEWGRPHIAA
jgi:hypothetical protein